MYCQNQIEDNGECTTQCEHCKKYYAPLELEEAADDYCSRNHAINEDRAAWQDIEESFQEGAEWQEKQMYSEDDLRKAIQLARLCTLDEQTADFDCLAGLTEVCTYGLEETYSENEIIEQFKKNK